MTHRVGIDLGTTNSAIAYTHLGKQKCVPVEENEYTSAVLPSAIGIGMRGELIVGERAKRMPGSAREFKRGIGTGLSWLLGSTGYNAVELSALVMAELKRGFERRVGAVEGAVITVPANFPDNRRHETKEAGRLAGLNVLRIINEPSAAAIAYSRHEEELGENVLVIDWGGGTLDVSLVDSMASVLDIKSNDGDPELGGTDIDTALLELLVEKNATHLAPYQTDMPVLAELLRRCEAIKMHLTDHEGWEEPVNLPTRDGALLLDFELGRSEFEGKITPLVDRVMAAIARCLEKNPEGALAPDDVSDIILVGGSCYVPLLRRRVREYFGKPGRMGLDPMEVVALGAAYQAEHADKTGDMVVVHSLATSLGVRCMGRDGQGVMREDLFTAILPSTSKLPARQSHTFHTVNDNQDEIEVVVFETDETTTTGLAPWDTKTITGLPDAPAGSFEIKITFDYNVEQVLTVVVEVPDHDVREEWKPNFLQRLERQRPESQEKIDKLHGRSLERLTTFADKVDAALNGQPATKSRAALGELRTALDNDDVDAARAAKNRLGDALFDENISLQ